MALDTAADARRFAAIAIATALIAVALRLGLGARWFSFYGAASVAIVALAPVTAVLLSRAGRQQRRRWPIWSLAAVTLAIALSQIGFWLFFFYGGPAGLGVGIGRAMSRHLIDPPIAVAGAIVATGWCAVVFWLYLVEPTGRRTRT
ncbi:MAG: hypothetical protein ACK4MF_05135 [Hyphomicrobiaceae bacterium]